MTPTLPMPLIESDSERDAREQELLSAFAGTFQTHSPPLDSGTTAGGARALSELAQAGLNGHLAGGKFRSLFWKVYFGQLPAPDSHRGQDPLGSDPVPPPASTVAGVDSADDAWQAKCVSLIQEERREYAAQRRTNSLARATRMAQEALLDPSPEEDQNEQEQEPSPEVELLQSIEKDVQRTFPEVPLFAFRDLYEDDDGAERSLIDNQEDAYRLVVQRQLTTMLFIWCSAHSDVGYRQGIHELAAACYYVRWCDRLRRRGNDHEFLRILLDQDEVEADAYALFDAVMQGMKRWYEWRPSNESVASSPAPILTKSSDIMALLNRVDPLLSKHLDNIGVQPQLFALRWVRLLFTREFCLNQALVLWDGIFAYDAIEGSRSETFNVIALDDGRSHHPHRTLSTDGSAQTSQNGTGPHDTKEGFALIDSICVAMLVRIRAYMLDEDYTQVITQLLRYPLLSQISTLPLVSGAEAMDDRAVGMFVQQAVQIRANPQISTGAQIASDNRDKLGVPTSLERAAARPPSLQPAAVPQTHGRHFAFPEGITDLAKGLYGRSEVLGIKRAVGSAVTNVQRTVSAYAQQAGHSSRRHPPNDMFPKAWAEVVPHHRAQQAQSHSVPHSPRERCAPLHTAGALETLRLTRDRDRVLGVALGGCIDALETKWKAPPSDTAQPLDSDEMASLMAITTLKHIRDVLVADEAMYNPSILASWLTRSESAIDQQLQEHAPVRPVPVLQPDAQEIAPAAPDTFPRAATAETVPLTPSASATEHTATTHASDTPRTTRPARTTRHMFSNATSRSASEVYPIRGLHADAPPAHQADTSSGPLGPADATTSHPPIANISSAPRTSFGMNKHLPLHERLAAAASHHGQSSSTVPVPARVEGSPTSVPQASGQATTSSRALPPIPTSSTLARSPSELSRPEQPMTVASDDPLGAL